MEASAINTHIHELQALRKQQRYWQWGIFLTLLLMVIVSLAMLRDAVNGLTTEGATQQQFVQNLSDRLQKNALPTIEQMGVQALREVDYGAEVKKLNQRTPELAQASVKEMQTLGNNLSKRGQKVFNTTFGQAFKSHASKIKTMFPEATDEQVAHLMTTLTEEAQNQVVALNDTLFTPHKKALDNMVHDLTIIENSESKTTNGQIPTWEMALMIFDIAREDLKALSPEPKQAQPKANDSAKAKEQKK